MNHRLPLAALALLGLAACATGPNLPNDYAGTLRTETDVATLVPCIEQAAGVPATSTASGTVIDASTARPPRRYSVTRERTETKVLMQGLIVDSGSSLDRAVTRCLVTTALKPTSG